MKILEIAPFSAGICGVWARVKQESELLAKQGHEVTIFSSNIERGSGKVKIASSEDSLENVKIKRFPTFASFGDNTYFWNFKKEALDLNPDVIITHAYRQYYSTKALKIAKKLGIPCILVTHAPFLEKNLRSWKLNLAVWIYDNFIGKRILKKYDKLFAITKWEMPYLKELGAEKITYVPNGIPDEFFMNIKTKANQNKIIFLGRIAPIKDIETLIKAFTIARQKNKKLELNLVGPIEEDYKTVLDKLISKLKISVNFIGPIYDLNKKLTFLDENNIFILPSKREAMPQALIEAMARGKIVISSKTEGGKEIIQDNKTGFLFDIEDEKQLAEKILFSVDSKNSKKIKQIKLNAKKQAIQFKWSTLIKKIQKNLQ